MLKKRRLRRVTALLLVGLGGLLMYLAPGDGAGVVLLASGIILELAGIVLERKA